MSGRLAIVPCASSKSEESTLSLKSATRMNFPSSSCTTTQCRILAAPVVVSLPHSIYSGRSPKQVRKGSPSNSGHRNGCFQRDNVFRRHSVEGAVHSSPIIRRPWQETFERNPPFQAYHFFRKTERVFHNAVTYTVFNDARARSRSCPASSGRDNNAKMAETIIL
jgi:hypothetical protein